MDNIELNKKIQEKLILNKLEEENKAINNLNTARKDKDFVGLENLERQIIYGIGKSEYEENLGKKLLKDVYNTKNKILKKYGLTLEDLTPKYKCSLCKDTGFYNGSYCKCFVEYRNKEIIKEYKLNNNDKFSFDNINLNLFTETERQNFIKLKNILKKWCDLYPNIKKSTIILSGPTGVGKTFLSKSMAKSLIERNLSVCYISAFEMNNIFLQYHSSYTDKKYEKFIPLIESDVLIIDDLGSEPLIKNVTINYLFNILSEREEQNKGTIITTNLSTEDIFNRYNERIASRLNNKSISAIFNLQGNDIRKNKVG